MLVTSREKTGNGPGATVGRRFAALLLVVVVTAVGCGDDDEGGGSAPKTDAKPAEAAAGDQRLASAAKELEAYLRRHTKRLKGTQAEPGQVVSQVEPVDGKLKVWVYLNGEAAADDKPAARVCALIKRAPVPEAKGALLVDAGDAPYRC